MTDQQRRELQARITNQRMEIRRLWAIEQVHWESVERWKATREGLEGKLRTAEAKLAEMEKHRDNMTELWAKEAAEKQVALGRAEAAEARLAGVEKERDEMEAEAHAHIDLWGKALAERNEAQATVATLTAQVEAMRGALDVIAEWKLPETGEKWPSGAPVSYETLYGSNGSRDFMRAIARAALTTEKTNG